MKNIHLLPTDKPSRLHFWNRELKLEQVFLISKMNRQHAYITNNEEIKNGDYKYDTFHKQVSKVININSISKYDSKIILTTDQDLIKDGVQAIDDEFLEWFVKNPSCDEVEVNRKQLDSHYEFFEYKIIIPKQETLEEVAERYLKENNVTCLDVLENVTTLDGVPFNQKERIINAFAKWQQQQNKNLYSEEEVLRLLEAFKSYLSFGDEIDEKQWFNQFKKK